MPSNKHTPKGHDRVITVYLNGDPKKIPGGKYVVSKLKEELGVPANEVLEIQHHELKELSDDETIEVHEGEKFISHVRNGSSG